MDKAELVEKLQQLIETYRMEAETYRGPAKCFYLGKMASLQEVLIWIVDDEDFYMKVMAHQAGIYESIVIAENSWNEMEKIMEGMGGEDGD